MNKMLLTVEEVGKIAEAAALTTTSDVRPTIIKISKNFNIDEAEKKYYVEVDYGQAD